MWAVLGLVTPTPSAAQAPEGGTVAATPQKFAAPDGSTLSLSLDEAVARALENNSDLAVERFNPDLSAEDVRAASGYYDPFLFAQLSKRSADTKGTNLFSGGAAINEKLDIWNFGVQQAIPTGADLSVSFNNNKRDTNNIFSTFNPVYASGLNFNLTQPLLRNFKIDAPRLNIKISKKNREISDVQFRQSVVNTVAVTKQFYYVLLYAIDNLAAARKNLDLAKKLLDENEIRVKVGTMAPLDVVTAQSEVASREEGVIVAENQLNEAEDNLKSAIFPQNDPLMWRTRIAPTDRPSAEPVPVDIEGAVQNALANRTDVVSARKSLENQDYRLAYAKNQLLPQLDLVAGYGGSGVNGTQIRDAEGNPLPQPIVGTYGDAVSEAFGFDFPSWTLGFNISYAIPNRSVKANAASAQLTKDQALASLRRLELQVAAEVRTAARGVESGFRRVASSQAARRLAAERLDAEEKKFAAGMSTNFFVTQAQRDLAEAEVSELRAVADYRISVINYQRVQEAGVGSSGAALVLSGGAGSAQGAQAIRSSAAAAGSNQF
jgi:outer membrane protein TolC